MTKISVILPVYNESKYLKQCLDSLIKQNYYDMEIICIDDGSSDGSLDILEVYKKKDRRIKVFSQSNQGVAAARNFGLTKSTGELILFLDSDDYFESIMVESIVRKAEKTQADIVIFRAISVNANSGKLSYLNEKISQYSQYSDVPVSPYKIADRLFNDFLNTAWNKLYKREFLDKYQFQFQNIKRTNDLSFVCKTLVEAKRIAIMPDVLLYYRIGNKNSLQGSNQDSPLSFYEALRDLYSYLLDNNHFFALPSFFTLASSVIFYNINRLKDQKIQLQVIEFLKEEGLKNLNLKSFMELPISWMLKLQYLVLFSDIEDCFKSKILSVIYTIGKIKEYYQINGIVGVYNRIMNAIN